MMSVLWIPVIPLLLQMHVHGSGEIWTDNNEIWMQAAAGPRQLTHDGIPKRLPVLAPSGNRLAYVIDIQSPEPHNQPPEEKVILVESTGRVLRQIIPEGYVPETFDRLEWIDDRRIGAMTCGHANCMYWILDSDSGKTLQVMQGGFDFIWSHNHQWVARRLVSYVYSPDGTPKYEDDRVMLNVVEVYPKQKGEDEVAGSESRKSPHGHAVGTCTWSPHDVWLGFTDTVFPEGSGQLVLVSPSGTILREALPMVAQWNAKIEWIDDKHLELDNGDRTFQFIVNGSKLQEITANQKE